MSVRETDKNPDKFVGLTFPLDLTAFSTFEQSKTLLQQTKSNLRNLLLTTKGERVFQPEFGSDLTRLIFDNIFSTLGSVNVYFSSSLQATHQSA